MTLYAKWDESSVPYIDASGNSMPAVEAEGVFDNDPAGTITLTDTGSTEGWYAAQRDFGGDNAMLVIDGEVNLILCDEVSLKLYDGVKVPQGSSLTIWAQSVSQQTRGSLEVNNQRTGYGIGTSLTENCGSVTVNGGSVKATGYSGAAAIGGLEPDVTINGGSVNARSDSMGDSHAPAIGGSVTVTGGVVNAYGDDYAPAIGSVGSSSTKVEISGGRVNAYSGYVDSPAIGAGSTAEGQPSAAADVTITGGRVTATVRCYAGIGQSCWGIGGKLSKRPNIPLNRPHKSANRPYVPLNRPLKPSNRPHIPLNRPLKPSNRPLKLLNRPHIPKNENALFAKEVKSSANRAVLCLLSCLSFFST